MSLRIIGNTKALGYGVPSPYTAIGGTAPYTYAVVPDGAGGTIDPSSGLYTAPNNNGQERIMVVDSVGTRAYLTIRIGSAVHLLCDIIQTEMGLAEGRVFLWDQKIFEPTDSGLFVVANVLSCKPFGNTLTQDVEGDTVTQSANFYASVQLDAISKSMEATNRKEELLMALRSIYAEQQQEVNSFSIGTISTSFTNLSMVDGAAIPYRFAITLGLQYLVRKNSSIPYFDTFSDPSILTSS